jgi:hypothetical protein
MCKMAGSSPLRVQWFERWDRALDEALAVLPESEACPHELFRAMASAASPAPKKLALVLDTESRPIAVAALRRRLRQWESICDGVVPGVLLPACEGRTWDALRALRLDIRVTEWLGDVPEGMRFPYEQQWFVASTRVDLDSFWRGQGNDEAIRKARRRCTRLGDVTIEIDAPDAAEWTLDNWERKWSGDEMQEVLTAPEMRVAVGYLSSRGRYHAFRLLHDGKPVAGLNVMASGTTLHEQASFRDPAYDRHGVGVHLDELFFRWAAQSPYERVVLGAGDYKARWGEPTGSCVSFTVCPAHVALRIAAVRSRQKATEKLRGVLARRGTPDSAHPAPNS